MAPFMMNPNSLDETCDSINSVDPPYKCTFHKQAVFAAIRNVERLRNAPCQQKMMPLIRSVWDIRAPDFAVKNYATPIKKSPPPKAVSHLIKGDLVHKRKASSEFRPCQNRVPLMSDTSTKPNNFILHFRVPTPNIDRRMALRHHRHPVGVYFDPKPYDHRGFPPIKDLGLPDMMMSKEPDPLNLRFKKNHLDIFYNANQVELKKCKTDMKNEWVSHKTPEPLWVKSMFLQKEPFRKRYAAFTRHRRLDRTAYSALMDRTEEDFVKRIHNQQIVN